MYFAFRLPAFDRELKESVSDTALQLYRRGLYDARFYHWVLCWHCGLNWMKYQWQELPTRQPQQCNSSQPPSFPTTVRPGLIIGFKCHVLNLLLWNQFYAQFLYHVTPPWARLPSLKIRSVYRMYKDTQKRLFFLSSRTRAWLFPNSAFLSTCPDLVYK